MSGILCPGSQLIRRVLMSYWLLLFFILASWPVFND
nr:MAG TPA: hypothetical protein [Caudoviricetes sp.]